VAENAQNYLNISNMNLKTGREYTLHVRAVNVMAMTSDSISTSLKTETETPTFTPTAGSKYLVALYVTYISMSVHSDIMCSG
jgi:hypothetical protein